MSRVVVPSVRRIHERRETQVLINQVALVFGNAGVAMSHSKISRLVRGFRHRIEPNGHEFIDYLVNSLALTVMQRRHVADELARVIAYRDPTGEEAVTRVLRDRGK